MENKTWPMKKLINCNDDKAIHETCKVLKQGGIIIYPTDTIYGFGCDANNESAIKKINKIKNRKGPMSVIAPKTKTAISWINIKGNKISLINTKIKNGNTIIVPVKNGICSSMIMGDNQTLGIRIPEHNFCKKLAEEYHNIITTTSVNQTGEKPLTNINKIFKKFSNRVELIIDDGNINGEASKIYFFQNNIWNRLR